MPNEPTDLDSDTSGQEDGVALSLSGGGYRAMIFHVGALYRLNEVGLLGKLSRISSVSGGSITAGFLGLVWDKLEFDKADKAANFSLLVEGMRAMADTTVDAGAVMGGILLPGSISDRVADAYDEVLFKGAKLRDLPDDTGKKAPRFVINATNIKSAVLWRFSRPYMGDYRVGLVDAPDVKLSTAVAASSAFPPILSPLTMPISQPVRPTKGADLNRPTYTTEAVLSDGGVYDNLGLETVKRFSTLLVSDAGQKIAPQEHPDHDWARHSLRVLDTIDNQVRSLRKRYLIESYERGDHTGTYWGIRTNFADYGLQSDPLGCLKRNPKPLAEIPTRLEKMPRDRQDRLMNCGATRFATPRCVPMSMPNCRLSSRSRSPRAADSPSLEATDRAKARNVKGRNHGQAIAIFLRRIEKPGEDTAEIDRRRCSSRIRQRHRRSAHSPLLKSAAEHFLFRPELRQVRRQLHGHLSES